MQINGIKIFFLSVFLLLLQYPAHTLLPDTPIRDTASTANNKTILIFNSYHPETKWSEEIVSGLQSALKQEFPGIHIHSGNLNTEELQTAGTMLLALRAIIWQMAEQEGDTINPESRLVNSIYRIRKQPDLIICIGEEAFFGHKYQHMWQGNWPDIPVICCAMNDSVTSGLWSPGKPTNFSRLRSTPDPENQRMVYIPQNDSIIEIYKSGLEKIGLRLSDKAVRTPEGKTAYASQYHTTGTLSEIPVRENLALLKRLMPKLKEIVWVDNYHHKSAYALYKLRQELPRILPDVKLSVIINNRINTDSIYNVMLKPAKDRVFITYAWNINGVYSRRPEQQIDSLFTHVLTSPILTLSERQIDKDYWLGGVHSPINSIVKTTLSQATQILNGKAVDSIPYTNISDTRIHLNVPALKRFNLEKNARQIEGVIYKNIPPSFYKLHERAILISVIMIVILSGALILIITRLRFTKKIQAEYVNYRKLYKRLQAIYLNSSINFARYDQNGLLTFRIINGRENNTPQSNNEILSGHLFTNPHIPRAVKAQIRQFHTVSEEIEITSEEGTNSNDKEKKKWNLIVKPLNSTDDHNTGYIAIAINLTPLIREQEAKQRSEHAFRFASETAGVGIADYNLLTGKGYASATWSHNLNEEKIKDTLPAYMNVCEDDRIALLAHRERIRTEYVATPFSRTIRVKDTEGIIHYVQEYIFVREFAPERNIITIAELNINYDQAKARENELQKAKEKAEFSNEETEQFLANISHEIRTPLNAIVGFSSILATSTDEEDRHTLGPVIELNNKLLITLIDNILYLSKLDSGSLAFNYTQTDAEHLFDSLISYARELANSLNIRIIKEIPKPPCTLNIDEIKLRLIMTNLISNAVKFTSQGEITIGYEKKKNAYYFFVKDTGCGIHPENQERIFKRFEKLDIFTQGTGLGLALCHSIITHQQGQIGVISAPSTGSTFWFTLPEREENYKSSEEFQLRENQP